ncbi:MAG: hypothetical protein LBD22_02830 [Spirochaetaceae bacterium]|jgi:hypothetical protein|nr:hypothetical protein [Spirochaetaceae bacterium]
MVNLPGKDAFFTAVMTAYLALAVVFAGVFVIENHIHDHTGSDCRICLEIQIALRIIEAFGRLGIYLFLAGFIKYAAFSAKRQPSSFVKKPIELKVRFNC